MIRNFAKHSSVEHFVKAARAKFFVLTLFWLTIFFIFFAVTIYQLVIIGTQLKVNNKVVRLKLQRQFPLKFPAVTVCNLNPYKMSSIQSLPQFTALVNVANGVSNRQKRQPGSMAQISVTNSCSVDPSRKRRKKRVALNTISSNATSNVVQCSCPGPDQQKYYKIRNVNTSKIVSLDETVFVDGWLEIPLIQANDNNSHSQQWNFISTSSDNASYYIYNRVSNKVLTYASITSQFTFIYDKPCNLKNQSFLLVSTYPCDFYFIIPSDMTDYYLGNMNYEIDNTYTAIQQFASVSSTTNNQQWTFEATDPISAGGFRSICNITENPASCQMTPDSNWFYKIIIVRNQKLLGINGSSLLPGEWVYQNDDIGDPAQEWAFQLVDSTNNAYRIYNRNSRLAMKWTEASNSGSLFQDNPDCSSKYEIFSLIQSNISGSCMFTLGTVNVTSYVTATSSCWLIKNTPAEGYPLLGSPYSDCQYFMLQKTEPYPDSNFSLASCFSSTTVKMSSSRSYTSSPNINKNFTCENGTELDTTRFYKILNLYSGKIVSFNYSVLYNGYEMPFVQSDDNGDIAQQWYIEPYTVDTFNIYNRASRNLLTVLDDPNSYYIFEKPCNLGQHAFRFLWRTSGSCSLVRANYQTIYLAPNGCKQTINTNIFLSSYDSSNPQCYQWILVDTGDIIPKDFQKLICNITVNPQTCELNPNPKKFYKIIFVKNQKFLDITNSSLVNGAKAQQNDETDQPSQEWVFQLVNDTTSAYRIYNRNSQMALTFGAEWTSEGNIFQTNSDCDSNSSSQLFQIVQNAKGSCNITAKWQRDWVLTPADECRIVWNQHSIMFSHCTQYSYPYMDCQNLVLQESGDVPDNFNFGVSSTSTSLTQLSSSPSVANAMDVQTTTVVKAAALISSQSIASVSSSSSVASLASDDEMQTTEHISSSTSSSTLTVQEKITSVTNILNDLISLNNTDPVSQNTILVEALPYLTTSMTEEERSEISYQLLDMLSHCTFNNQNCDIKNDLFQWNDITVGNCFTFNHRDSINQHYTTQVGPAMGLKILFKVNQNDYLPTTQTSGIRVFIHDQDQTVFPETEGYTVSGSFTAEFSMNYGCIRTCYQKAMLSACGCGDPRYALSTYLPQIERYCGIDEAFCIQNSANTSMNSQCSCLLPCFERLYPTTMTLANLKLPPDYSETDRQQSVLLDIYYETFDFVIFEEVALYTPLQFLSDMGGIVGNNLGFSFITIFEILFFVALMFGF